MKLEVIEVPIAQVNCDEQVRREFEPQALLELANTIRSSGLEQPIRVARNGGSFRLISGERRLRAAKLAGLTTINAVVEPSVPDKSTIVRRQLIENCQRVELSPMEKADAVHSLMTLAGCTAAEVAVQLGWSEATVCRFLKIRELPAAVQAQVGKSIPLSAAYELTKVSDATEQVRLATEVEAGTMNRDVLVGRVRTQRRAAGPSSTNQPAPASVTGGAVTTRAVAALAGGRSITLAAPDLTLDSAIDTLEDLLNRLRRARTQGLALPTVLRMLRDTAKS